MDEKQPRLGNPAETIPTSSKQEKRQSTTRYLKLNRLPTLQEVLDRRTRPPLDLYCFYIFLQREAAEDALDFWLDVQQHENMCKAYFKDLKRSGRTIEEDWPEFASYARTNGSYFSAMLPHSEGAQQPADIPLPMSPISHSHPNSPSTSPSFPHASDTPSNPSNPSYPSAYRSRRDTESHGPRSPVTPNQGFTDFGASAKNRPSEAPTQGTNDTSNGRGGSGSRLSVKNWGRTSFGGERQRRSKAPTIIQRDRAIEKDALVDSAERIYLRYLLPGAEKEIYLPPSMRMPDFPQSASPTPSNPHPNPSPLIPDLFHQQKLYIFRALDVDAFPRFLRAKAFSNLTPAGSFWRLITGLLILWGGFVLGFSLIFLDYKPRALRVWTLLPFIISINLLLSAYYSLSPLLALLHQSEITAFKFMIVREAYVRRLLLVRAVMIEAFALIVTAALTCIFVFVPGHRL